MDAEGRSELVLRGLSESLTEPELRALFATNARPRAYIGFEPSGRLTVGHLVCARKMRDLLEADCALTLFLADWHAWINDKLGGSLERIRAAGEYMVEAFAALGVDPKRITVRWAHELAGNEAYWTRVLRIAKGLSLARTRRAMTVLGRGEAEADLDTAKLFYPAMQAADIFELPVEIAYAGLDQRRAHVVAREAAHANGWPVPVAVHTPLISSLAGGARMDPAGEGVDAKMSKSDPRNAILLPSTPEEIRAGLGRAFCPAKEVEGNPVVELARFVTFPWEGKLSIERAAKHGGSVEFATAEEFLAAWSAGSLHPADLKSAVAGSLERILAPVARHFADRPETLRAMTASTESRPQG
ncbi:MAG: tyrosine--tRNA ligase [Thermoplasmata archaeon]|nr:tyrosine--tRNA ligase [Thermoplasmata archaeon]